MKTMNAIQNFKVIVSMLTIQFWMSQKCGKMKDYSREMNISAVE
jgi:hypothetical protein